MLNRYGDYPFSMGAYANIIAYLRPDYYASMDYPCEPEITRSLALTSNLERIRATVANARMMADDYEAMLPGVEMVPVIQGWTLDEYKTSIDLYGRSGMIRPYMAVGSMCTRSNDRELERIIPSLHDYASQAGVKHLHFFGLKMSPVTIDLSGYIYSRDSAAVLFANNAETKRRWGGRFPRTQEQKKEAFSMWFNRAVSAGLIYKID